MPSAAPGWLGLIGVDGVNRNVAVFCTSSGTDGASAGTASVSWVAESSVVSRIRSVSSGSSITPCSSAALAWRRWSSSTLASAGRSAGCRAAAACTSASR